MRKTLKVLHTLSAAGLMGGLACHMILLIYAPQETPATYAELRQSLVAINNYVVLPSLFVALVSGLVAMAVHTPFLDKGWALIKAVMGILMFKGVLTVVIAKTEYASGIADRIAAGEPMADALEKAIAYEWYALWAVMALSVLNVVLGVWRPARINLWPFGSEANPTQGKLAEAKVSATAAAKAAQRPEAPH